eukprot:scaffold3412_cov167-Chaetoceros_neogracile.AAC.6
MQRIQQLMMMIMIMRLWRKYISRTNTKLTARRRNLKMKSPKREPLAITLLILHVQQSNFKNQRLQYTTLKKKIEGHAEASKLTSESDKDSKLYSLYPHETATEDNKARSKCEPAVGVWSHVNT